MPHWYAHLAWTASPTGAPDQRTAEILSGTLAGYGDAPGSVAYVLAPEHGTWRAGLAVAAESPEDACAAAAATLRTAALHAGQHDARLRRVEIVDDSDPTSWMPPLTGPDLP
jgi:hypothetical protein